MRTKPTSPHCLLNINIQLHYKISALFGLASLLYSHFCFRTIFTNGDIYEGGWSLDRYYSKGEWEYYKDGSKEIGQRYDGYKQGKFECYDKSGTLTHTKIYKDDKEIKWEEVKQQI